MKFNNDGVLREMSAHIFMRYGKDGLMEVIDNLEARIRELESSQPKRPGRPRKNGTNEG